MKRSILVLLLNTSPIIVLIPRSRAAMFRANAAKARRFRRTAKRELARRG